MRILMTTLLACLLAACAAPPPLPRAALVPMYDLPSVTLARQSAPPVARQPAIQRGQPSFVDSARDQQSVAAIYRTVVEIVEVPVEVPAEVPPAAEPERPRDCWQYDDYLRYRTSCSPYRRSQFPINTVVGAGIGAIIGSLLL